MNLERVYLNFIVDDLWEISSYIHIFFQHYLKRRKILDYLTNSYIDRQFRKADSEHVRNSNGEYYNDFFKHYFSVIHYENNQEKRFPYFLSCDRF